MLWSFVLIGLAWAVPFFHLRGRDLSAYDVPDEASMSSDPPSAANAAVQEWAAGMSKSMSRGTPKQRLASLRTYMDDLGDEAVFDGSIIPVSTTGVKGEWLLAPGADSSRRLLLNSFEVDAALLDLPLNDADSKLLQIIREQADRLLQSYTDTESIEAQLRLLIMKDLEFGPPSAKNVARQMGMSLSTFKRFLARQNLGFRALRDSVIRELATRALAETDVRVSQVAMRLGYSEVSAFNHAFLRLVGQSPREYRRQLAST